MEKTFVSIMFGLMMLGVSGQIVMAAPPATDLVCDVCVNDTDIADGAVTDSKIAAGTVSNGKIANGAVTDAKIAGPISAGKLEKPANVIVVAKSGGDFTSVQAALASLPDPNTTPTIIKVMPGIYTENITMKSHIHLQGSGRDVTTIQAATTSNPAVLINNLVNVAISDITISGGSYGIRNISSSPIIARNMITGNVEVGIYNSSSSPMITANIVSGNGTSNDTVHGGGIVNNYGSLPVITGNIISGNGSNPSYPNTAYGYGIYCENSSPTIIGNTIINNNASGIINGECTSTITSNIISGNERGIYNGGASTSVISGNKITSNNYGIVSASPDTITGNVISGNAFNGIYLQFSSTATITSNKITGSGVSDISSPDGTSTPNISFNLYNTVQGTGAVGMYNVKSDGTPAPISNP